VLVASSWVVFLAAATVIVTGATPLVSPNAPSSLRLTMLDVGQGDAMVLEIGRQTLIVDTGGSPFGGGGFDIGARVVEPALWAMGVRSFATMLLTHGDPDHIGGAAALVDDFHPDAVWQGVPVPRAETLQAALAHAAAAHSRVEERREGEAFAFGGARILVLHPPPPDWERRNVRNDDSVVLEVVYGDVALLLTGDIGSGVEREIAPHLIPAPTRILKVAHHGSRTSTSQALLDAWRPQIALISCGRGNPFGHPAPEVIARLNAIGAAIYRTDRDGEITIESNGSNLSIRTYAGEHRRGEMSGAKP
jgi:competence protein ComEC